MFQKPAVWLKHNALNFSHTAHIYLGGSIALSGESFKITSFSLGYPVYLAYIAVAPDIDGEASPTATAFWIDPRPE